MGFGLQKIHLWLSPGKSASGKTRRQIVGNETRFTVSPFVQQNNPGGHLRYRANLTYKAVLLIVYIAASACSTISQFNQKAYENATSLKVEALMVMKKATEPFEDHRSSVEELIVKVDKVRDLAHAPWTGCRPKSHQ